VLPHPSWRNVLWVRQNPWFEAELLPGAAPACVAAIESARFEPPRREGQGLGESSPLALDPRHVVVAEAEMVADLVNEDVAYDMCQILAGLAPIIEDRTAVEEDHVDRGGGREAAFCAGKRDARDRGPSRSNGLSSPISSSVLLVGKLLDADDDRARGSV